MLYYQAILLLAWITLFVFAFADPASSFNDLQLHASSQTSQALRRAPIVKRDFSASTTLDKRWTDATIFNG